MKYSNEFRAHIALVYKRYAQYIPKRNRGYVSISMSAIASKKN